MPFDPLHLHDWHSVLDQLTEELSALDQGQRHWLDVRIATIRRLQTALDHLFTKAGGATSCTVCKGGCCGCGTHHVTLTNLLAFLLEGKSPPEPDFNRTCPFLGDKGCLLPVSSRPYNCITFFCDQLEENLDADDRASLRDLDRQLRQEYLVIAERYPVASLRGLWIAVKKSSGRPLLHSTE